MNIAKLPVAFVLVLLSGTSLLSQSSRSRPGSRSRPTTSQRAIKAQPLQLHNYQLVPDPQWKQVPTSGTVRLASWVLPRVKGDNRDAQLNFYYFGSSGAGSADANLTRWKGMIVKPAGMSEADHVRRFNREVHGVQISEITVRGTFKPPFGGKSQPQSMLWAAVIETKAGPYYLRVTGPEKTMEAQLPKLKKMVSELRKTADKRKP